MTNRLVLYLSPIKVFWETPFPKPANPLKNIWQRIGLIALISLFLAIAHPFSLKEPSIRQTIIWGFMILCSSFLHQWCWIVFTTKHWSKGFELSYILSTLSFLSITLFLFGSWSEYSSFSLANLGVYWCWTLFLGLPVALFKSSNRERMFLKDQVNQPLLSTNTVFTDSKSQVVLSLNWSQVLFVKAQGNYIILFFHDERNGLRKKWMRKTLSQFKQAHQESPLVQIHRSFLVNPEHVDCMTGKSRQYELRIRQSGLTIPISRSYEHNLLTEYPGWKS